jgi:type II pantothenate kinase
MKYKKISEMNTLVTGLNYVATNVGGGIFTFDWKTKTQKIVNMENMYPLLLVNIGSGVSILKVDSPDKFERVSGSSLGGGTLMGLAKLTSNVSSFDDLIKICDCEDGDNKSVDLLVGDIYGANCDQLELPSYVIASNLGKIATDPHLIYTQADIVRSLIYMISDNISQIAYMNYKEHSAKHILFSGSFMILGPALWKKLSFGIEFWSSGQTTAKFIKHTSHLGAIGSLVSNE